MLFILLVKYHSILILKFPVSLVPGNLVKFKDRSVDGVNLGTKFSLSIKWRLKWLYPWLELL